MPFVNSVPCSPERNIYGGRDGTITSNCVSCTASGAVCLINHSHSSVTSELAQQFAYRVRGVPGASSYEMGLHLTEQLKNTAEFVHAQVGRRAIWSPEKMPLQAAVNWMSLFSVGTVFVVAARGYVAGCPVENFHMLNAINNGNENIAYIDFQSNRQQLTGNTFTSFPGHAGPATSNMPFISVTTQQHATSSHQMHATHQPGTFNPTTVRLTILAFPKHDR